jgi:arsenate reductase
MKNILVLCTGNSCRSQLAEGYLKYFSGSKVNVYSGGIEIRSVNPNGVDVMKDDYIGISH